MYAKKLSDMDKRIKLVWLLSIITISLIFCGQIYWLYNQFEYNNEENVIQLENVCRHALNKDLALRETLYKKNKKKVKQPEITIKIWIKDAKNSNNYVPRNTDLSYIFKGMKKTVNIYGANASQAFDLYKRFQVSSSEQFRKERFDSILIAEGYDSTRNIKLYKTNKCFISPVYTITGNIIKHIHVNYSYNPLTCEAVCFDIDVPVKRVMSSMAWQLSGSVILLFVLIFCLWYQIKTIIIQKRIDGIRHEFMKNMIYEMKQPAVSDDDEPVIHIGHTEFMYTMNELHYNSERVIITSRQAEILRILADRKGEMVSREEILESVWGNNSYANSMALNVQITYLRRALKSDKSVMIDSIIKKGYVLRCDKN